MTTERKVLAAAVVLVALLVVAAYPATAWKVGTHERIAEEVAEEGDVQDRYSDTLVQQAGWADSDAAEDGNGAWGYSEEKNPWYEFGVANFDHFWLVNNLWPKGDAPKNAAEFVQNAKDYVGWGYTNYGMKLLGRGQHYVHDASVLYHTKVWWIDDIKDHNQYESWVNQNWATNDFDDWTRYGAYYGYTLDISTKQDIKKTVKNLAEKVRERGEYIDNGKWTENVWATQYNLWAGGKHTAAVYEYAAPGYYSG